MCLYSMHVFAVDYVCLRVLNYVFDLIIYIFRLSLLLSSSVEVDLSGFGGGWGGLGVSNMHEC